MVAAAQGGRIRRILRAPVRRATRGQPPGADALSRVVVVGAAGQLGSELVRAFAAAGHEVLSLGRPEVDLEVAGTLDRVSELIPEAVVNAAAWTDVDGCARDPDRAMRVNGAGAGSVASAAARAGALVVQISSNEVFDGSLDRPYREDDATDPINPYGASKLAGERAVADATARHLIVRTSWLFSTSQRTFPARITAAADRARAVGDQLKVVADEWGNPTWVPALALGLVAATHLALEGRAPQIVHLAGWPPCSRLDWARAVLAHRDDVEIIPIRLGDYERPSRVPPRAVLDVALARELGIAPPDWRPATASLSAAAARH